MVFQSLFEIVWLLLAAVVIVMGIVASVRLLRGEEGGYVERESSLPPKRMRHHRGRAVRDRLRRVGGGK